MKLAMKFKKFTLIELLVVVAIISILASLLLPSLNSARCLAKRSTCTGNLKQIGLSIMSYADSYDGFIPRGHVNYGTPFVQQLLAAECRFNGSSNWQDYVLLGGVDVNPKNKIFGGCPSLAESPLGTRYHHMIADYGFNSYHPIGSGGVFSASNGYPTRKLQSILQPTKAFAFMDATAAQSNSQSSWYIVCQRCWPGNALNFDPRHRGGSCMTFFDGHCEWRPSNMISGDINLWCCDTAASFR